MRPNGFAESSAGNHVDRYICQRYLPVFGLLRPGADGTISQSIDRKFRKCPKFSCTTNKFCRTDARRSSDTCNS
jgi:hypothetical protein